MWNSMVSVIYFIMIQHTKMKRLEYEKTLTQILKSTLKINHLLIIYSYSLVIWVLFCPVPLSLYNLLPAGQ